MPNVQRRFPARSRQRPAETLQQAGEFAVERCLDAQSIAVKRVLEAQSLRVQQQSMHVVVLLEQTVVFGAAVAGVADQRVAQMREMTADLAIASGLG